jgi:acetamidase/formamidase
VKGWFSREYEPVATIDPGESVTFSVPNAGWFWDPEVEPERPAGAGHALYGPIEVRGARAGDDTLVVHIDEVRPRHWGRTWADGETFTWELDGDTWRMLDGPTWRPGGHEVASAPFLGVIGMPPPESGEHSTTPPRRWGGNIDCKELVAGTTLYLPLSVDGAWLMAGDGHGAQGDGEVSGTAIECPVERATLTIDVVEGIIRAPRARIADAWLAFGFDEDLDLAAEQAIENMLDLVQIELGLIEDREKARALASVAVDLRVTQVVNEVKGVHAVLRDGAIR